MRGLLRGRKLHTLTAGSVALLSLPLLLLSTATPADAKTACVPLYVGVPGSGQNTSQQSSSEVHAVGKALQKLSPSITTAYLDYPAVPWYRYTAGKLDLLWNELGASEATGEQNLHALVEQTVARQSAANCAPQPILIAGYSQGAEVAIRAADSLPAAIRERTTVAVLGNPSFVDGSSQNINLNTERHNGVRPSLLFGQAYTPTPDLVSRVADICAASDPICSYQLQNLVGLIKKSSAHYNYTSLTINGIPLTTLAAQFLWNHRYTPPVCCPQWVDDVSQLTIEWLDGPTVTYEPQGGVYGWHVHSRFKALTLGGRGYDPENSGLITISSSDPAIYGSNGGVFYLAFLAQEGYTARESGSFQDSVWTWDQYIPNSDPVVSPHGGTFRVDRIALEPSGLNGTRYSSRTPSVAEAKYFTIPTPS